MAGLALTNNGSGIVRMRKDGTNYTLIPDGADAQSCSMDHKGNVVAMVFGVGAYDIYYYPADGSARKVIHPSGNPSNNPNISFDGSMIVFNSVVAGNRDIYRMNVDGSNVVRLTSDPDWDTQPVLSMDKSKVAFTSYRNGANNGDIYTVHSDGSTETRLTSTTDDDEYPAFSPDGTKIAFTRYAPGNDAGDLYIMNADGTNVVKVTDTVDGEYAASFSVDGTRLFYAVDNKGGSLQGIVSCNLDGSDQKIVDATASTWKTCGWVY